MQIATASSAALSLGLHPGMPIAKARLLVPGLDIRPAEPERDAALLARLALFAARRWTPRAAVSGQDGLWLDLGGVAHLFGGERKMCARILRFCTRLGLTARIAVAGTTGAAHALARYGRASLILCPNGAEIEAIAELPLAALRLSEEALSATRRLGIERVGELVAMPRGPLGRRFGRETLLRLDQATGRAREPFDPIVPEEAPCAAARLAEPIASPEAIGQVLADLMVALVRTLERTGLAARKLILLCDRIDGKSEMATIGTARATRDGPHLLRLLTPKIETIDPGFGIEAMRLVATRIEPLGPQPVPGELTGELPPPDIVPLIDQLTGRLGVRRLFRLGAVESDIPERSVRKLAPLEQPTDWPHWPRPICLLSPPEPVEQVMSVLPDGPPRRFRWRGRDYRVAAADGPERLYGEWWRASKERDSVRDYFQIEDGEGQRFWLFRQGDGENAATGDLNWRMHGVFG